MDELIPPPDADTASVDEMVDYFVRIQKMTLEAARAAARSALESAGDYQAVLESAPASSEALVSSAAKGNPSVSGPMRTGEVSGAYGAEVDDE